jgi:hypothetical protein
MMALLEDAPLAISIFCSLKNDKVIVSEKAYYFPTGKKKQILQMYIFFNMVEL